MEISVHKGLSEIKTLTARYRDAICSAKLAEANRRSNTKINGKSLEETRKNIQSSYDSIVSISKRKEAIKLAVLMSNAVTKVTIGGKTYTVAEAIDMKNRIPFMQDLLIKLEQDYTKATAKVQMENDRLENAFQSYVKDLLGANPSADATEAQRKIFFEANTYDLIDPLDLKTKIMNLKDEIFAFTSEVDVILSESNAVTKITVPEN